MNDVARKRDSEMRVESGQMSDEVVNGRKMMRLAERDIFFFPFLYVDFLSCELLRHD